MQCTVVNKVKYLEASVTLAKQRWAVFKKIRENTLAHTIYPGLKFEEGQTSMPPENIPGLMEAGWVADGSVAAHRPIARQRGPLYTMMKKLIEEMRVGSK
jgi:hypothetical protein